jgi:hypothetical protein
MAELRECTIEGCGGKHYTRGLCQKHYNQRPERQARDAAITEERRAKKLEQFKRGLV